MNGKTRRLIVGIGVSVVVCLSTASVWAADYSWTNTAAGTTFNWNNAGSQNNWVSGFPSAVGDGAYLTNNIVGAQTIRLNQAITVGTLKIGDFNGSHAFTVVPNGGSLILDNGASSAVIAGSGTGAVVDLLLADILLNSPLDLSGSATTTHLLTLGGVISTKDSGQAITVTGGSMTVTNQNMTYANGWTVQSNATLNASGRSYGSAPNNIVNFALGTTVVANAISVLNGGTLASSGTSPILHMSGPITLNHGATLRQTSSGGGRVATFADITVADAATVSFSYYGNIQENKLRFGTLTLLGNATLDIVTISGVAGGGNVGVDPAAIENATVTNGTIATVFPDYTTAEGLKLGAGKTLTKTGNGAFLLNSTNAQFAGSLDVQAGVLSLGHANALNATSGNFVRSNAMVSLRTSGFGVTAHRLNGAVVTQEVGSVERWYHGAARFVAGASDSYTPPPGVALQVGLFGTPLTHDWSDAGSSASHVLRLTGNSLGVWAEMQNNQPQISTRAEQAIRASRVIAGYSPYLASIEDLTEGKLCISTGMTREEERVQAAIEHAKQGETVAIISSGDAGVYGMAGLAIEMAHHLAPGLSIEIIPGISAANSAAAALGAPLMLDYAVISLSDLLVPWEQIRGRLEAVAAADMVVALYNPRSTKRVTQLEEAVAIFLKHRPASTPVGIGTAISSPDQRLVMTDLGSLLTQDVNMRSIVIIGNTQSKVIDGYFVTPRGYQL